MLFVRKQFLTSRHSVCLFEKGLDTSLTQLCLFTRLQRFLQTKKKFYYVFTQNSMEKPCQMKKYLSMKWLKKIKYVRLGRNDVYSDYKELKFWVGLYLHISLRSRHIKGEGGGEKGRVKEKKQRSRWAEGDWEGRRSACHKNPY